MLCEQQEICFAAVSVWRLEIFQLFFTKENDALYQGYICPSVSVFIGHLVSLMDIGF